MIQIHVQAGGAKLYQLDTNLRWLIFFALIEVNNIITSSRGEVADGVSLRERLSEIQNRGKLMINFKSLAFAMTAIAATLGTPAAAQIVTFSGADNSVTSPAQMTNSNVAAANFNAAVTGGSLITFEGALPAGVAIAGGLVTNDSGCGALCGFNITSGGQNFLLLEGGNAAFSFVSPIDFFGLFITGLQADRVAQQTLTFSDGSSRVFNTPFATGGGGAFFGFTDFGQSIVSVTFHATNDIVSLDDVRFGRLGAVPEPSTWAMMLVGFGFVGGAMRRKASKDRAQLRLA